MGAPATQRASASVAHLARDDLCQVDELPVQLLVVRVQAWVPALAQRLVDLQRPVRLRVRRGVSTAAGRARSCADEQRKWSCAEACETASSVWPGHTSIHFVRGLCA